MPIPFALNLFTALFLLASVVYFGSRKPAYRHWRYTISELGEVGNVITRPVGYGLFLSTGLLVWLVTALTDEAAAAGLAVCLCTGYVVAAFFPCDAGSPVSGSGRQQIHNLGGAVEYLGGAYFLMQISTGRIWFADDVPAVVSGCVVVGTALLSVPQLPVRGLIQRVVEIILFGSLLLALADWESSSAAVTDPASPDNVKNPHNPFQKRPRGFFSNALIGRRMHTDVTGESIYSSSCW